MSTYYRVSPQFWNDPMVRSWDDDTTMVALYLLTCPHRNLEGLFRFSPAFGAADMEWSPERFQEAFDQLLADGFCEFDEKWQVLLIVKALKWQNSHNTNQAKAAVKELQMLPQTPLRARFVRLAEQYAERLTEALPEGFGEGLTEGLPEGLPSTPAPAPTPENPSSTDVDRQEVLQPAQTTAEQSVEEQFAKFWDRYPARNGKKLHKAKAVNQWKKLTLPQRRRAYVGAGHYADAYQRGLPGVGAMDAFRWLRDDCFEDWQTPAEPDTQQANGPDGVVL